MGAIQREILTSVRACPVTAYGLAQGRREWFVSVNRLIFRGYLTRDQDKVLHITEAGIRAIESRG